MVRMTSSEMIALIERHMDLETHGDVAGVMSTLTPDVTWGTPDTIFHQGADAVEGHYIASITPPGRFQARNFRGWADEVQQTAVGFWDCSRPGEENSYPIVAVFEFKDGLISSERLFHDGSAAGCGR